MRAKKSIQVCKQESITDIFRVHNVTRAFTAKIGPGFFFAYQTHALHAELRCYRCTSQNAAMLSTLTPMLSCQVCRLNSTKIMQHRRDCHSTSTRSKSVSKRRSELCDIREVSHLQPRFVESIESNEFIECCFCTFLFQLFQKDKSFQIYWKTYVLEVSNK